MHVIKCHGIYILHQFLMPSLKFTCDIREVLTFLLFFYSTSVLDFTLTETTVHVVTFCVKFQQQLKVGS